MKTNVETLYNQWKESAETTGTYQLNHGETTRDVYTLPDNTTVYDHFVSPWNFLKKSFCYTIVDITIPVNDYTVKLLESYGGTINEFFGYTDDGFGLPQFEHESDSLKLAFDFVCSEKENLLSQFKASI